MIDVTILYSPDGSVSSSIAPLEVFYAAGTRWNLCVSSNPEPRFTVTTVSVDGKPVVGGAGVRVIPDKPLSAIEHTDLVLIPAGGTDIDVMLEKNAAAIPWLQELHAKGTLIAGVCTGVAILAEAGLARWTPRDDALGGRRPVPAALSEGRLAAAASGDRGSRRALRRRRLRLDRSRALHRGKALRPRHRDRLREIARGADAAHLPDRFLGRAERERPRRRSYPQGRGLAAQPFSRRHRVRSARRRDGVDAANFSAPLQGGDGRHAARLSAAAAERTPQSGCSRKTA